jgi:WAS/WASL-interacting protein
MSDNENQAPSPSKQTSTVPLKKETVRVTLKAADSPAVPSATVPLAPPVRPPVPGVAPRPPAPTIPLRPAGAPAAAPAPTIRLATAPVGAPAAPTVALKPPGSAPTLPKATVQLQLPPAAAGASATTLAPTPHVEEPEEEESGGAMPKILAGVGLVAALVLLALQLMLAATWINAGDNPKAGEWSQLIE